MNFINKLKKEKFVEYSNVFLEAEDFSKNNQSLNNEEFNLLDSIIEVEKRNKKNRINNEKYKIIMLGETYLNWLKDNDKNDSLNNREIFAEMLTTEELEKEWLCNGGNINIVTTFLPFVIFQENIHKEKEDFFVLSEETIKKISNTLSLNLDILEKDIYVLNRALKYSIAREHVEKITTIIESKLIDNTNISYGKLENKDLDEKINLSVFCLPIGLKLHLESYIVPRDWKKIEEYRVVYSSIDVDKFSDILEENFNEKSKNETRSIAILSPMLLFVEEINDIYNVFVKKLKVELKKVNMDINLI